eukprot:227669_1
MGICSNTGSSFCTERNTLESNQPEEGLIRKRTRNDSSELRSFHGAIATGNKSVVMRLVKDNPKIVDSKYNEQSPLTCAVKNKQYKIIKYLLSKHAFINVKDGESGDTPLHVAVRHADLKAVRILCKQYNADQSIENEYDETPIHIAMEQDTHEIASYLQSLLKADGATLTTETVQELAVVPMVMDYDALIRDTSIASVASVSVGSDMDQELFTQVTERMTEDLFTQMQEDASMRSQTLKPLEGWLERKQHSPPYSWLKRWVVVKSDYLLWSERHMDIVVDAVDATERKRWNKCIPLKKITVVEALGKSNKKFKIVGNGKEYIFRANNQEALWILCYTMTK